MAVVARAGGLMFTVMMSRRYLPLVSLLALAACSKNNSSAPDVGGTSSSDAGVSGPATEITAAELSAAATPALESSMSTNALAALLAEIASDPVVAPRLSFTEVPQGL